MRTSTYLRDEAVAKVEKFFTSEGLKWNGEKYIGQYRVIEHSVDVDNFDCPEVLTSGWMGETNAICIYNEDEEEVFACAYWCEDNYIICNPDNEIVDYSATLDGIKKALDVIENKEKNEGIYQEGYYTISQFDTDKQEYIAL